MIIPPLNCAGQLHARFFRSIDSRDRRLAQINPCAKMSPPAVVKSSVPNVRRHISVKSGAIEIGGEHASVLWTRLIKHASFSSRWHCAPGALKRAAGFVVYGDLVWESGVGPLLLFPVNFIPC